MHHKAKPRLEILENRILLAGDVPTYDDGIFAIPGTADELASFEIRRTDADVNGDDDTTLVGFVTDDGNGALDSIRSNEAYDVKALARARHRIVYYGDASFEFKLKGGAFFSFGIIKEARVSAWLRSKTQQQAPADVGFLHPVEENEVATVRALGNQAWGIRWNEDGTTYSYELQFNSPEFERDLLIESFVNSASADDAPGLTVKAGDFVSRNFTVTNPGSVSLTNVVVTDDNGTPDDTSDDFSPLANVLGNGLNLGDVDEDGELDPGEVWLYSSPHTAVAGQFTSQTVVTAQADGLALEASDSANFFATSPDVVDIALLDVISTPSPFDRSDLGEPPLYQAGENYLFRPVIRNTGNVAVMGPFEVQSEYRGMTSLTTSNETLQPNEELTLEAIEVFEAEEGTYPIEFRFDPNDLIVESDESVASNVWATDLEFAKPDISIEAFVPSPSPLDRTEIGEPITYDVGQTYQIRPSIRNTGKLPKACLFEVEVSYRDQSFLVSIDEELQPDATLTLDPIEITETEAGEFEIVFVFDPNGSVDESDESDESNVLASQLRFR